MPLCFTACPLRSRKVLELFELLFLSLPSAGLLQSVPQTAASLVHPLAGLLHPQHLLELLCPGTVYSTPMKPSSLTQEAATSCVF